MISEYIIAAVILTTLLAMSIVTIIIGVKAPKYKPSRREIYDRYIHSRKWKKRRFRALVLGGHKCALCNSKNELQVHHLSYEHLGKEKDYELQVLCHSCHQEVQGRKF